MTAATSTTVSTFSIFRRRDFTLIWLAQFVSMASRALAQLAAGFYVYQIRGSAADVGLMLVAATAPSLLFGLIAGVVVDRSDRRRVLYLTEITRALIMLAVPLLLPSSVAWLYILTFAANAAFQFFDPAVSSILPELATEEELAAAYSFFVISGFGSQFVGFILGGLLIARFPVEWAFVVASVGYASSALLIFAARIAPIAVQAATGIAAVWANLRAGIGAIGRNTTLLSLFGVFVPTFWLMGIGFALVLPFAVGVLDANETQYGFMEAAPYIGVSLGGLLMASVANRLRDGMWLALSLIGMGATTMLMGTASTFGIAWAFYFLQGMANVPNFVARSTIIQRNTAREMRGRVFSAFFVMRDSLFLLGSLSAGLADTFGARTMFVVIGLGWTLAGLISFVLPGLGRASATWRRGTAALQPAPVAALLSGARPVTVSDVDRLTLHVPALARRPLEQRQEFIARTSVRTATAGATILRLGDTSDAAYFILEGCVVAGITEEDGTPRVLEIMNPGDFFGEIAALTGQPRSATVSAVLDATLLEVPAEHLREMASDPQMEELFTSQMNARLARSRIVAAGHFGNKDQDALLDLRTPQPELHAGSD